jgi:hypothetical protein
LRCSAAANIAALPADASTGIASIESDRWMQATQGRTKAHLFRPGPSLPLFHILLLLTTGRFIVNIYCIHRNQLGHGTTLLKSGLPGWILKV